MIEQSFIVDVQMEDDLSNVVVKIGADPVPPNDAAVLAMVEHMMSMYAASSGMEFNAALEKLCEGARTNRITMLEGRPPQ